MIFLSFYSSSDTCPQYLSAANTSCSGARSPLRSMEKRVPQSTKRATGAPSAVLAYGVGLIPHLFVPFYAALVVFARATPALGVRRIGVAGLAGETLDLSLCVSTTCERCASSSQ